MNRNLLLTATAVLLGLSAHAQYETVVYDYSKNWFGENQPLPAEERWMLTGETPEGIKMVELQIFQSGNRSDRLLHASDYQRAEGSESTRFTIPVNYKLHGNTAYDFKVLYFQEAGDGDMRRLSDMVNAALTSYLNQSVVAGKRQVSLAKHPRIIIQDLDQIVMDGLELYRNRMGISFDGFSDIVYDKLERMDDLKLKAARFNILKEPDADERQTRVAYFQQNMEELAQLMAREVNHYLSGSFYVLREARRVTNYKSESTRWTLPINLGYAAVYDNLTSDDFAVEGAPMVGISFPLGNPNFSGKFLSNSSLSAGLLLQNVTLDGDRVQQGPLVNRPLYFAYGYKTAYFLRINAGATVMEEVGTGTVRLSPFIGLSVELNLWLGLNR
ncbi:MAG: hypothetical protein ABR572_10275 [Cryomorphaceae bacterium]